MMITTRAFLSCNKEPLRGHDSTQDLAASIEAEAMLAKVHHHHHHHEHDHNHDDHHDCNCRLEGGRGVEVVQGQELPLLTHLTISKFDHDDDDDDDDDSHNDHDNNGQELLLQKHSTPGKSFYDDLDLS